MLKEGKKKKKTTTCQSRILYPAKLSFKNKGEIKTFPKNQKPSELVTARCALQDMHAQGCPAEWNKRTLDSTSKWHGKINVNYMDAYKASITIAMVYNCTFCFLQDLRG